MNNETDNRENQYSQTTEEQTSSGMPPLPPQTSAAPVQPDQPEPPVQCALPEEVPEEDRKTSLLPENEPAPVRSDEISQADAEPKSESHPIKGLRLPGGFPRLKKDEAQNDSTQNIPASAGDTEKKPNALKEKIDAFLGRPPVTYGLCALCMILLIGVGSCGSASSGKDAEIREQEETIESLRKVRKDKDSEIDDLNEEITGLQSKVSSLEDELDEIKNGPAAALVEVKNAFEAGDYEKTVSLYDDMHKQYNGKPEDKEAGELAKQAQTKLDEKAAAEKAAKEEEERRKAEEEAKGYETGITFDQLARTPDDFIGKKVKFTGKVIQVQQGDSSVHIRLAVNSDYDTILLGEYEKSLTKTRILEDDIITIYGISMGEYTYKAVMGNEVTVPSVLIEKIDQ